MCVCVCVSSLKTGLPVLTYLSNQTPVNLYSLIGLLGLLVLTYWPIGTACINLLANWVYLYYLVSLLGLPVLIIDLLGLSVLTY